MKPCLYDFQLAVFTILNIFFRENKWTSVLVILNCFFRGNKWKIAICGLENPQVIISKPNWIIYIAGSWIAYTQLPYWVHHVEFWYFKCRISISDRENLLAIVYKPISAIGVTECWIVWQKSAILDPSSWILIFLLHNRNRRPRKPRSNYFLADLKKFICGEQKK